MQNSQWYILLLIEKYQQFSIVDRKIKLQYRNLITSGFFYQFGLRSSSGETAGCSTSLLFQRDGGYVLLGTFNDAENC